MANNRNSRQNNKGGGQDADILFDNVKDQFGNESSLIDSLGLANDEAALLRSGWNAFRPKLAGAIREGISQHGEKVFGNHAKVAGIVAGEAVNFGQQIAETASYTTGFFKKTAQLREDLGMGLYSSSGGMGLHALMTSDNPIIQTERSRALGQYGINMTGTIVGGFSRLTDAQEKKGQERQGSGKPAPAPKAANSAVASDAAEARVDGKDNGELLRLGLRTVVIPGVQSLVIKRGVEKYSKETTFDMIKNLAELREAGHIKDVPMKDPETGRERRVKLEEYVVEIFQHFREDQGQKRYGDLVLNDLSQAASMIAQEIREGMLDPMSLVVLVGENRIIDERNKVASRAEILEQFDLMRDLYETVDPVSVETLMEDYSFQLDEIAPVINGLEGDDQAFFASLFPNKVLSAAGIPDDSIDHYRERVSTVFLDKMEEVIHELNGKTTEELTKDGFRESEIKQIMALGADLAQARADGVSSEEVFAEAFMDGSMEKIHTGLRNAVGYWTSRVTGEVEIDATRRSAEKAEKTEALVTGAVSRNKSTFEAMGERLAAQRESEGGHERHASDRMEKAHRETKGARKNRQMEEGSAAAL